MGGSGDIFGVGVSGLQAFQRSLSTISHNISNVNTDGYSRQRVELDMRYPQPSGAGFIGNGVKATSTQRMVDQHTITQVRTRNSAMLEFQSYHEFAVQVDNLVADPDAGLAPAIEAFFDSIQGVADDPTAVPAREVMLTEAEALVDRFHIMEDWLQDLRKAVNDRVVNLVGEVNALTKSIADMNQEIVVAIGEGGGQPPNDMLDQRDRLIDQLSEHLSLTVVPNLDGTLNIFAGNGQAVVLSMQSYDLEARVVPEDPLYYEVAYKDPDPTAPLVPISSALRGGDLGGTLAFRDEILRPSFNHLGRLAIGLAMTFNDQHNLGMDLNGDLGQDFFAVSDSNFDGVAEVNWAADVDNLGGVNVEEIRFVDAAALTIDDYTLTFDGANYILENQTTGVQTTLVPSVPPPPAPSIAFDAVDGFEIQIDNNTAVAGDIWYIRPTRNGARLIETMFNDPNMVAAADPLRSTINVTNIGDAEISEVTISDLTILETVGPFPDGGFTTPRTLTPPLLIEFDDPPVGVEPYSYSIYDNTVPGAPVLIEANIPYNPTTGVGEDVFPTPGALDPGYRFTITGEPVHGDQFFVEYNINGISDNRNALRLADLQIEGTLQGGTATYHDTYSKLVVTVGNNTHQAETNMLAQEALLSEAKGRREAVSGVNLDEEAANMLRFQQAYAAAAQVIAAADEVFQTLLAAVRR